MVASFSVVLSQWCHKTMNETRSQSSISQKSKTGKFPCSFLKVIVYHFKVERKKTSSMKMATCMLDEKWRSAKLALISFLSLPIYNIQRLPLVESIFYGETIENEHGPRFLTVTRAAKCSNLFKDGKVWLHRTLVLNLKELYFPSIFT